MKYNDKISVIIPTYNRAKELVKSINSVLKQTYDNIEIIVVDDGSTDNTKDVVNKISKCDSRVKYYSYKNNKGACYARNYALKKITGKYVTFQDSDDEYIYDKLETQYNNLIKKKTDMDFCMLKRYNNNEIAIIPNKKQINSINNNMIVEELCNGNYISLSTMLIKASIIKKYKFDESIPRFQDYDFFLRIVSEVNMSFTNKILLNVYISKDSITKSNDKLLDAICIIMNKEYKLTSKQINLLKRYLFNTYKQISDNKYFSIINELNNKYKNDINCLIQEKNDYKNELNNIYNSKGYRILNKFYKFKSIFRKKQ